MTYHTYSIKDNEAFDASHYPSLVDDLQKIKSGTLKVSKAFREEILISYTKHHCLKLDWLKENPELTSLVTSRALPLGTMETLFAAGSSNVLFVRQLEDYIKESFSA